MPGLVFLSGDFSSGSTLLKFVRPKSKQSRRRLGRLPPGKRSAIVLSAPRQGKTYAGNCFTNGDTAQVIAPNRDPRIDPQAGDAVRGNGQVRRVMAREGERVRCASGEYDYRMRLDNWQKWCRLNGATAVRAAASSRGARKTTAA